MLPELTTEELSAALDAAARDVLDTARVDRPPVDALRLAEALGLTVAWDARLAGRGRIVRLGESHGQRSRASILLRPEPRRERRQWVVAHEIGEACAMAVFDRLGIDPREAPANAREKVADQLAARLLLPGGWFAEDAGRLDWDVPGLKSRYDTASHELIARRMLDFEPRITITIFDQGRRTFRRGNCPRSCPPLLPAEQAAWQQVHAGSASAHIATAECRVQAWPVHEPGWQREILRTHWRAEDQAGDCD